MKKTITLLTILLLIVFMVGCENSVNPITTDSPTLNIAQAEATTNGGIKPLGREVGLIVSQAIAKPSKPSNKPNAWNVPGDFASIQDAIDDANVLNGDFIYVGKGEFAGALVDKGVNIIGNAGKTIIDDGPVHRSGNLQAFRLEEGSDNSSFSHLIFLTEGLDIMNAAAVNNVEVHHNTFNNSLQAISNWIGSGWNIHHNNIYDLRTDCGGGIGIMVADYLGSLVENNIVMHNEVYGTINVSEGDCGTYSGTGIVIYADFRWGRLGSDGLKNNTIEHNKVSLVSSNSDLVPAVGLELTNTADPFTEYLIVDNVIRFNDLRGTANSMELDPEDLDEYNDISKNHINP